MRCVVCLGGRGEESDCVAAMPVLVIVVGVVPE